MAGDVPLTFKDMTALVTGGSRGIGFAIAEALAARGCNLIVTGRNQESLNEAAENLRGHGTNVMAMMCDVRVPMAVESLFTVVKGHVRTLDILVNNAGMSPPSAPVQQIAYSDWRETIETNLTGLFLVTHAALPLMRDGASIVNNLSVAATRAFANASAYVASKHGAMGFTKALREEMRPRNIRVIALLPGATDTDLWQSFWPDAPRGRMMKAETVAQTLVDTLALPQGATVEELVIGPTGGAL